VTRSGQRWSWPRQAMFLGLCLTMGAYVAFDLLDLDGSSLRGAISDGVIAVGEAGAETERICPQPPSPAEVSGVAVLSLVLPSAEVHHPALSLRPLTCTARLARFRPRTQVARKASRSPSPTDPA
jgi:hypothetical protein